MRPSQENIDKLNNELSRVLLEVGEIMKSGKSKEAAQELSAACENIKTLLSKGADVNYKISALDTPVILAVKFGSPELLDIVIKAGANFADVDINGQNLLRYAVDIQNP